ncbi:MAG: hypothetical protein JNM10_09450 [Planctomycetia bacterium]|nr:hypothetical protein [Planctomycetia bacterium]
MVDPEPGSALPWQDFEGEVAARIEREVNSSRTAINPRIARVCRRPAYLSRDRGANIVFDVAVEAWEDEATEPSLIWVIECKDYPSRRVDVGEVEEFAQKLDQISPMRVKGTMVTRLGFQGAALNFATARGISLFTLGKELVRILHFDAHSGGHDEISYPCTGGVGGLAVKPLDPRLWNLDQLIQVELRRCGILPPLNC